MTEQLTQPKSREKKKYASEADLCAAFLAWAKQQGWTSYAETAGWDIVLVKDGIQVGVEAKLRFNATLMRQVLPGRWDHGTGPHHRGILLPSDNDEVWNICDALGLIFFYPCKDGFAPVLDCSFEDWSPSKPCELPEYIPDVVAGASSPVQLSHWKIGALKIMAILEIRGHVSRDDFRSVGIDHRRWVNPVLGWLKPDPDNAGGYVAKKQLGFKEQHPTVYAQILADIKAGKLSI